MGFRIRLDRPTGLRSPSEIHLPPTTAGTHPFLSASGLFLVSCPRRRWSRWATKGYQYRREGIGLALEARRHTPLLLPSRGVP